MTGDTRTAQELYRYARETPSVMRNLERTFDTLDKHKRLNTDKALDLLMSNVKTAAKLYVQSNGLSIHWWRVFPAREREGCAALFLRMYDPIACAGVGRERRDG